MADDAPNARASARPDKDAEDGAPKRKVNLVVAVAIVVLLSIIGAGVFFSFRFVEDEKLRTLNEWQIRLGIVADSRVADVNKWLEANFDAIAEITQNASLQLYMTELTFAEGDSSEIVDEAAQVGYLRNFLVAVADSKGFSPSAPVQETNSNVEPLGVAGIALVDVDGKPIVATPAMPAMGSGLRIAMAKALDGEPSIVDMYKGATNLPTMGFALPVYGIQGDGGGQGIGVAIGVKNVGEDLFETLKQPGDTSLTTETYLVRKTGNTVEYLSPLRDGAAPLKRSMAFDTPDLAAAFALENPGGFAVLRDYAGDEVLAVSRAIADIPWVLVRKISRKEALSASETRLQTILVVFILIIIGITVAMIAVWRHGTSLRAAAAAEKYRIAAERFENVSKFMRVITNSQSTNIVAVDGTTTYTFANEPAAKEGGMKAQDMLGKTMASVMGPVKAKCYAKINEGLLADFAKAEEDGNPNSVNDTRQSFINQFENENGELQVIRSDHIPLRGDRDFPPAILMIMDDITELSQAQIRGEERLRQLVTTLAGIVDRRDPHGLRKSRKVGEVARAIVQELELDKIDGDTAEFAGALRDLGNVFISSATLAKSHGDLSEAEADQLMMSYKTSAELLEGIDFEGPVVDVIKQSAERIDGSGPLGLMDDEILLPARIVAVAEAFVTMCLPEDGSVGLSFAAAGNNLLQEEGKYERKATAALLNYLENHGGTDKWAHFRG